MNVSSMLDQFGVTSPAICSYNRTEFDRLAYEWYQTFTGYIRNSLHSHSPVSLRIVNFKSKNYNVFAFCTTPTLPFFFFYHRDISFINFYRSGQKISSWANHCDSQFMQPRPGRLVTTKAKRSFNTKSTRTVLLTGYKPNSEKPCPQWITSFLENCSGGY